MDWPNDSDGDVMRRLQKDGFDFTQPTEIDFNIDFDRWPPDNRVIEVVSAANPHASISIQEEDQYVVVQTIDVLTYEFVIQVQAQLTEQTKAYGGCCESWGVLWNPNKPRD